MFSNHDCSTKVDHKSCSTKVCPSWSFGQKLLNVFCTLSNGGPDMQMHDWNNCISFFQTKCWRSYMSNCNFHGAFPTQKIFTNWCCTSLLEGWLFFSPKSTHVLGILVFFLPEQPLLRKKWENYLTSQLRRKLGYGTGIWVTLLSSSASWIALCKMRACIMGR